MNLVDTHCHVQSAGLAAGERGTRELWAKDPSLTGATLVDRAAAEGVTRLMVVGCDIADSQLAVDFVQQHDQAWASIGIHPHEAAATLEAGDAALKTFTDLLQQPKVQAIGECGLDFFYNHSPKAEQLKILQFQLELAAKYDKPVIFHVREAFDDFWPIFDKFSQGSIRGVLHSFTDSRENLDIALEKGLYIGVNGIVTFAKSEAQLAMYKAIPLERLLLETDAPFLTPTPFRGTINEPKQIRIIAEFLAKLRGEDLALLAQTTTANACKLFGI